RTSGAHVVGRRSSPTDQRKRRGLDSFLTGSITVRSPLLLPHPLLSLLPNWMVDNRRMTPIDLPWMDST
ncbi:hypothetical protein PENTCL1PPCAC_20148, partial [Pristionchus entomophagus]